MKNSLKQRHLNLRGEVIYDFRDDILLFKAKDRAYAHSLELQNYAIDIDTEGFVTGVQVFDASKVFGVPKTALRDISGWHFQAAIENKVVTVILRFAAMVRNRVKENFTQQITQAVNTNLKDSTVECVATA